MVIHYKSDLWSLIWGTPQVDPNDLAAAIEEELAQHEGQDFRTRLLIRDGVHALEHHWGKERLRNWLQRSPVRTHIEHILHEEFGSAGFPLLKDQLVEKTDPEVIREFLRDLGSRIKGNFKLQIGGSVALILTGHLARATTDIDVVDEVPAAIRGERKILEELKSRYHLELAHFQSHYLPAGWEQRLHYADSFGSLRVYTVDVYDAFLCKLFSKRTKDLDDLRFLRSQLDKDTIIRQFQNNTQSLQKDPSLREQAEKNWYILFGEPLPSASEQGPSTQP